MTTRTTKNKHPPRVPIAYGRTMLPALTEESRPRPALQYAMKAPWLFPLTRNFFLAEVVPFLYPYTQPENGWCCLRYLGLVMCLPWVFLIALVAGAVFLVCDGIIMIFCCLCLRSGVGCMTAIPGDDQLKHADMMRTCCIYPCCLKSAPSEEDRYRHDALGVEIPYGGEHGMEEEKAPSRIRSETPAKLHFDGDPSIMVEDTSPDPLAFRTCCICRLVKEKNQFSKTQWRKRKPDGFSKSKCRACLNHELNSGPRERGEVK